MPFRILLLGALFLPASVAADAGGEAPRCESDPGLAQAAGELLLAHAALSSATLTAAVRAAGSDAVAVHALLHADAAHAARWLEALARRSDAGLVCGEAQSADHSLLLAAARGGRLAPIDAREGIVRGDLAQGFDRAELVVEDGSGELQRFAVDAEQLRTGVALAPGLERPVRVQLLAHGKLGPRPVAERVLGRDAQPDATVDASVTAPHATADPAHGSEALERDLADLRARAGRPALRHNALLADAAQKHAARVCASGQVAHELAPGEDPTQRLRSEGIVARRIGETVARAESFEAALRSFMGSPSHRLTLLEHGFTDAGVGSAVDTQGKRCVVVLLAAWPRFEGR